MSDFRYEIALPLLHGVGLTNSKQLVEKYGSAQAAFDHYEEYVHSLPGAHTADYIKSKQSALQRADKELNFIAKHNICIHYYFSDDYPYRLKDCVDAPFLLYGLGNYDFNCEHVVSVVGTRMPTDRGREWCRRFVTDIAQLLPDTLIVSGLAYGIDVTSHRAALDAGLPTLIIPAHGLDRVYPAMHRQVAQRAISQGGILTEFISGTEPERQNFVQRNRIIAGLADAVVVVESKEKGGSLITADMACSYGKDVFALPGRFDDECSAGCNKIIKYDKARLIENAEDLLLNMMWDQVKQLKPIQTELPIDLEPDEQAVMDVLHKYSDGIHVNQLVQEVKMSFASLSALLFTLEMKDLVKALPGAIYRALK